MEIASEVYLAKLKDALTKNGVFLIGISLGAFSDDSLCLEEKNGKWTVYSAERGNRFDVSEFDSLMDACLEVIHRVSASDMEEEQIRTCFSNSVSSLRSVTNLLEKQMNEAELKLKYEEALFKRREAYHPLGMNKEAVADYSKSEELNHDLAEAYNRRGFVYITMGRYEEALMDYTKAISLLTMLLESHNQGGFEGKQTQWLQKTET